MRYPTRCTGESLIVQSTNFEFIRANWPELADLAAFAEKYVYDDTPSCLVKLRNFCEGAVAHLYQSYGLSRPYRATLVDLIHDDGFRAAVPARVVTLLDTLREVGNKGAHGAQTPERLGHLALESAFDVAKWMHIHLGSGKLPDIPTYRRPPKSDSTELSGSALDLLNEREEQIAGLQKEIKERAEEAKLAVEELSKLKTAQKAGDEAADSLGISEDETRRRMIDMELAQLPLPGWNLDDDTQVSREFKVADQPTPSGEGYADYVLWNEDGKPLSVIEAKRTARDPQEGEHQAKLYADALEKQFGQRPLIVYSNGPQIWLWDDAAGYPPRKVWGYYSRDSLNYLVNYQRRERKALNSLSINAEIAGRLYQMESIKAVCEKFEAKRRKALIVLATGTGKTRVSIALCDLLMRAGWVRRTLFLCDRKELRKQAYNAFGEFLSGETISELKGGKPDDHARFLMATYPGMMRHYLAFDIGYFDLIIADESHRSIYNRYRSLFDYFDCLQVGLTATPVDFIERNTFRVFDCDPEHPTAYYPVEEAIRDKHLVPWECFDVTTKFLREGIRYDELTKEQREQLEDDIDNPSEFEAEKRDIDRQVLNKGTAREILRNLMENGIRDRHGQQVGKSIIFARSHKHALVLKAAFDDVYPQYGGQFCQIIDNYVERAEQRIDDFKLKPNPVIAISVDMLDTGIDVPEVVNLVFAKPVKSLVKFWQMIGRGTRLCEDLFGPGEDKQCFRIFDHWENFDYFSQPRKQAENVRSKSLSQKVFEARLELAEASRDAQKVAIFDRACEQLRADIRSLPMETIPVREKYESVESAKDAERFRSFRPNFRHRLRHEIAPLMQWRNIHGHADAYLFDFVMLQAQTAKLINSTTFSDHRDEAIEMIAALPITIDVVRAKETWLERGKSVRWWYAATVDQLEEMREELRGVMRYRRSKRPEPEPPIELDVQDKIDRFDPIDNPLTSAQMRLYEQRVTEVLRKIADTDPTLARVRRGEPVSDVDFDRLTSLVLTEHPDVNLKVLRQFYGHAVPLAQMLRRLVGLEADAVDHLFGDFVQRFPQLSAKQTRFLRLLKHHVAQYGSIEIDRLYDAPFTQVDENGLDGVFDEEDVPMLIEILKPFQPPERVD